MGRPEPKSNRRSSHHAQSLGETQLVVARPGWYSKFLVTYQDLGFGEKLLQGLLEPSWFGAK